MRRIKILEDRRRSGFWMAGGDAWVSVKNTAGARHCLLLLYYCTTVLYGI